MEHSAEDIPHRTQQDGTRENPLKEKENASGRRVEGLEAFSRPTWWMRQNLLAFCLFEGERVGEYSDGSGIYL